MGHDPPEPLIAFEQPVQRFQLLQVFSRQWPACMAADERPEPFPQASCLSCHAIQFLRQGLRPQRFERLDRDKASLRQPVQ